MQIAGQPLSAIQAKAKCGVRFGSVTIRSAASENRQEMADCEEPPAKQQCSSDPAELKAWDTWLDVSSVGVHCGHGPVSSGTKAV